MQFLEIAKEVRLLGGVQGIGPVSVVNTSGYEGVLVQFVKDAWEAIQNMREDWNFMFSKASFPTIASQDNYTLTDIFLIPQFKVWKKDSFKLRDTTASYLNYKDPDRLEKIYLNSTAESKSSEFTIERDHSITLKPTPDSIYTITANYYRSPQLLKEDTDVPILPVSFHRIIVYGALQKLAVFLSSPEIYTKYKESHDLMLGQLMRAEVPAKRIKRKASFV